MVRGTLLEMLMIARSDYEVVSKLLCESRSIRPASNIAAVFVGWCTDGPASPDPGFGIGYVGGGFMGGAAH